MTEKIGGYGKLGPNSKLTQSRSTDQTQPNKALQLPTDESAASDAVSLTDTATRLQKIEARLRDLPDVDRQRVDELRQLIDAGDYEIDAEQIAARLIELERQI